MTKSPTIPVSPPMNPPESSWGLLAKELSLCIDGVETAYWSSGIVVLSRFGPDEMLLDAKHVKLIEFCSDVSL